MALTTTAIAATTGLLAMLALAPPGGSTSSQLNPRDWETYRNHEYRFELKQAPRLTLVPPGGTPSPAPKFRLWFQRAAIANQPIETMAPPPLAVDIYDNPSRLSVDAWLDKSGIADAGKFGREHVSLNLTEFLRLTGRFQLVPDVFYFIARGPYVYRFTPSGLIGELMLASVSFLP